jgi:spore photoproduct lyase
LEIIQIKNLLIDRQSSGDPLTARIRERLSDIPQTVVDDAREAIAAEPGERGTLILMRRRGSFIKEFTVPPGAPPCGERYIVTMLNCPYSCSYCYLRSYLDHRRIVIFTNIDELASEVERVRTGGPGGRLTTGEMGDSLALDHLTGTTVDIMQLLSGSGITLDVRTKSCTIDHLLDLPGRRENLVITWTLGPEAQITAEERGAASLAERIEAAGRAAGAGIAVGVRLDPIIPHYYNLDAYREILDSLAAAVGNTGIARFELGVLRFPPGLWERVRADNPTGPLLRGEFFPDGGGKIRLYRPARVTLYRRLSHEIRRRFPEAHIELSMEDVTVWEDAGLIPPDA